MEYERLEKKVLGRWINNSKMYKVIVGIKMFPCVPFSEPIPKI